MDSRRGWPATGRSSKPRVPGSKTWARGPPRTPVVWRRRSATRVFAPASARVRGERSCYRCPATRALRPSPCSLARWRSFGHVRSTRSRSRRWGRRCRRSRAGPVMTSEASGGARAVRRRRLAIILSGGGARGAYEAGVLWYLFDELARLRKAPPRVHILCGTSVGAINSAYLAAHLADPMLGVRRLAELWSQMRLEQVVGFGGRQALSLPRVLLGGGSGSGLFDVSPMSALVQREIPWRAISRTMRNGYLDALSVSTTEVSTGRTVIFMQTSRGTSLPSRAPPRTLIRADRIGPLHALASAAIPLLFPPVRIGNQLYADGALRQNTPIAPALRLGATHVLVVGTSRLVRGVTIPSGPPQAPSATFFLGKIMNALLLDHLDNDIGMVNLLNDLLASGTAAYGPGFVDALGQA